MVEISDRMAEFLHEYSVEFDPETTAHDVRVAYPWFPEEFEQLLRERAFRPSLHGKILYAGVWDTPEGWESMDYVLRQLWQAVYPDRTYPYDEPGVAPPELADSTDARGVSHRLARLLAERYQRHHGSRSSSAVSIGETVKAGGWSWLPRTLEAQIRAGVLTPTVWSELIYAGDPSVDEIIVDRDLRELWTGVAPDQPYPIDTKWD